MKKATQLAILLVCLNANITLATKVSASTTKSTAFYNTKNAIPLPEVISALLSADNKIKDDPFDKNYKKAKLQEVFSKYINVYIFIPEGEESKISNQKLTTLELNLNNHNSFGLSFDSGRPIEWATTLGYLNSAQCENYSGDGIYANKIKSCSSNYGSPSCKNTEEGSIIVDIPNFSTDTARSLSGNIERYVIFNNIKFVQTGYGKTTFCLKGNIRSIYSDDFTYYFVNKVSGDIVFKLEFGGY